jgi:hypothetical protein
MRITCIWPLGHTNIQSTEEGTPKFLMYQMCWGIAGPTCLLGSSGPPEEQEPRPTIRQKKMRRRRRMRKKMKKQKKLPFTNA